MTTLNQALIAKYPQNGIIADKWLTATGTPFSWESLTKPNMAAFSQWLCANMARSSARNYCAKLKAAIEPYTDEITMPRDWRKFLTVKDDESQHVYLTEAEIRRIIDYKPDTMTEATVQQQFILGCLTGARHGDYSRFTQANITPTGNLVYVSQKTHIKAELPLSPVARDILFADGSPFAGAYKREVSDSTFNDTIRRICDLCDIDQEIQLYRGGAFWRGRKYEAVSSHTSRRSFCTNLYLRCRDLLLVSKLAGHSSTTMTERYVCCGLESLTDSAMQYFSAF
jgi:integrase